MLFAAGGAIRCPCLRRRWVGAASSVDCLVIVGSLWPWGGMTWEVGAGWFCVILPRGMENEQTTSFEE